MNLVKKFIDNHVLANITFALVIILGVSAFIDMPRARDPHINLNWLIINTALPGASSIEVEKRITDPLENTLEQKLKDIRFVSSTSRDGFSSIIVRFTDIDQQLFQKRVAELRREVQSTFTNELPDEALDPYILELTTSSGFPAATLAIASPDRGELFRRYVKDIQDKIERLGGVDGADLYGVEDPELHIAFYPDRLVGLGITPADLANTVRDYFSDVSIGDLEFGNEKWLVRLEGTSGTLDDVAEYPIVSASGVVKIGELAEVYRTTKEPTSLVAFADSPAVMLSVTKKDTANIIEVLDELKALIEQENLLSGDSGYSIHLIDDQTLSTRQAISLMQNNALIGLFLVVLVTYLFLGGRIAMLTSIGIPFTLAGTFIILHQLDMQLSNPVLLGVVIALGMLVDDAVVVVEAIHYRLQRGQQAMQSVLNSLQEVFAPVLTSVLTTVAVFLPLMFLPGIVGQFMRVIPIVVCLGLLISLLEAFWILPAHVSFLDVNFKKESRTQRIRRRVTRKIRFHYTRLLILAIRNPKKAIAALVTTPFLAVVLIASGWVKLDFFASDPFRIFYVNAELPSGTTLERTLEVTQALEDKALEVIWDSELTASVVYSGLAFTETEALAGDNLGQVFIALEPKANALRDIQTVADAIQASIGDSYEEAIVTTLVLRDGPPIGAPINLKLRGQTFPEILAATEEMRAYLASDSKFKNIKVDFKAGNSELVASLNGEAIKRAGVLPGDVKRSLQSFVDGELILRYQQGGEEIDVRTVAASGTVTIDNVLQQTIATPGGGEIAMGALINAEYGRGYQNIRHYNYQRAVTITAEIDESQTDAVAANAELLAHWNAVRINHPGISLNPEGQLDDIDESLSGMGRLFLVGIGLVYMILGTQFRSYFQPLLVMTVIPLAFAGVIFGLSMTRMPLSLWALYGVVALAGISVNAAIVLLSAANARVESGMSILHATVFAARRRVIPVLITSSTTMAGLFSLAAGFAGKSLVWGPVATAIVSGLFFSTLLILISIPMLYRVTARFKYPQAAR